MPVTPFVPTDDRSGDPQLTLGWGGIMGPQGSSRRLVGHLDMPGETDAGAEPATRGFKVRAVLREPGDRAGVELEQRHLAA